MQTKISKEFNQTIAGQRAEKILRSCVHCGFCTATCPTYQLLGDELDSPRGRIYLIKQMLEGNDVSRKTQQHLDRCLSCRSCETTCPSGVQYSHLLDIGRELVDEKISRPMIVKAKRWVIKQLIPYPKRFAFILNSARTIRPALPSKLKKTIPVISGNTRWSNSTHSRKMIVLDGCAQASLSPSINAATSRVLSRLGIELSNISFAQCCGAVNQHMNDSTTATRFIKNNIDQWHPLIESGEAEAIITTASGCGAMVKEYGYLLEDDKDYANKAKVISDACKDISEVISNEDLSIFTAKTNNTISFHSPCTLQHALQLNGVVENILTQIGYQLSVIKDAHLCCGSAGTYSILQPEISTQLRTSKLDALQQAQPELIATANIGCLHHLASATETRVLHWIELLDQE